ncbi:MAG: metalloprotease [Thermoplasmata archaeon]
MSGGLTYPLNSSWTSTLPRARKVTTSRRELLQIGTAFAVLTLDFVLIFSGASLLGGRGLGAAFLSLTLVAVAALTALSAFVAHEVAHKVAAQRSGSWAEFRWSLPGLAFSVLTSYLGFLFAAPGATVVSGMVNVREWGKTALAGPMTNLAFGAVFYAASVITWYRGDSLFVWLLVLAFFNSWFGTFNLIPGGPLDGAKVLRWNTGVWAAAIVATGAMAAVTGIGLYVTGSPVLHP